MEWCDNTRNVLNKQIFKGLHLVMIFFFPLVEKCFSAYDHWWVKMFWLFHLHPPILIQTLFKEGVLLDIENFVGGTSLECLDLEDCLLYMGLFVLLMPAAWLILESWWTQGAEHQLQWLLSVVPLVSEVFFAGHSLILSESSLAPRLPFFPAVHPKSG